MPAEAAKPALTPVTRALGLLGAVWCVGGVVFVLSMGMYRISPAVLELSWGAMSVVERVGLLVFVALMLVGKGWFGLHRGFAPRVVIRARELAGEPRLLPVLLAPLVGMGLAFSSAKRLALGWGLIAAITVAVQIILRLPEPWRGIVDAGVIAGLGVGVLSLVWHALVAPLLRSDVDPSVDS